MSILIKNGRVIDPSQKLDKKCDIFIDKGKIAKIGSDLKVDAQTVIDAAGKIVSPGFVDIHAHLREPGREDKETVESGLSAAVKGGFTTVCSMPNTNPACDSQETVKFLFEKAALAKKANLLPVGTITKRREGKEISQMAELKAAGCVAVTDDGDSVQETVLMRKALEYAAMLDMLVMIHAEDKSLFGKGVMCEGYYSTVLGLTPVPSESESIIVGRDIQLAELTGARIHFSHLSSKKSVELVRGAKKRGVKVTAEVTPHHLTLEDKDLMGYDTNMKVNPPISTREDREALKKALQDGTIDAIATDHAPHLESEKEKEFDYAPFGMIGFETALSLSYMELVEKGYLSWPELIAKMTSGPCGVINYKRGTLTEENPADITVIDPDAEWVYDKKDIVSKSKNSPFIGWKLKARVTTTIVNGKIVFQHAKN